MAVANSFRPAPATFARAKIAASEVAANWSTEQLNAPLAADRLSNARGITLQSACDVIRTEAQRRRLLESFSS